MLTVGDPGIQGAAVTGTQGIGVRTPSAAAVAEATVGLAVDMHMPKGRMLTPGTLSIMVAAGVVLTTRLDGIIFKLLGEEPKLQVVAAPAHTSCPIVITLTK